MEQIIEYRSYAAAKTANDVDPKGWDGSDMRSLAAQIEHDLAQEEIRTRG